MNLPTALALFVVLAEAAVSGPSSVEEGIRKYKEGLLADSVTTLEAGIVALSADSSANRSLLVQAHLHKGAALVGLAQEGAAKEAFRQALALEPTLRLAKGDFPDRIVRVFNAARTGKTKSVMARPIETRKKAGLGTAGIAAIAGGVAALAGGAAVVASGGDGSVTTPPLAVGVTVAPQGSALVGATVMSFTGSGATTYSWDFGDGVTAEGTTATHVFMRAGTFDVRVTGREASRSATAGAAVIAKSLEGPWNLVVDYTNTGCRGQCIVGRVITVDQHSAASFVGATTGYRVTGSVRDPRSIEFDWNDGLTGWMFSGTGNADLTRFEGRVRRFSDGPELILPADLWRP